MTLRRKATNKLAFLQLCPHARPWRVSSPQPTLRAVPEAASVGRILASAMAAEVGVEVAPFAVQNDWAADHPAPVQPRGHAEAAAA